MKRCPGLLESPHRPFPPGPFSLPQFFFSFFPILKVMTGLSRYSCPSYLTAPPFKLSCAGTCFPEVCSLLPASSHTLPFPPEVSLRSTLPDRFFSLFSFPAFIYLSESFSTNLSIPPVVPPPAPRSLPQTFDCPLKLFARSHLHTLHAAWTTCGSLPPMFPDPPPPSPCFD